TKDSKLSGIQIDNTEIVAQISGVDNTRIGIDGAFYSINGTIADWTITQTALSKTVTVGSSYKMITTISAVIPAAGNNYTSGLTIVTQKFNTGSYAWDTKLIINSGSYNDGGAARYGFSIWDNVNSRFLMNIGYGGTDGLMKAELYGLTITGTITSSIFSTTNHFTSGTIGVFSFINSNYLRIENNTSTSIYARSYLFSTALTLTNYNGTAWTGIQLSTYSTSLGAYITVDGYQVPKCFGVRTGNPTSHIYQGDYYFESGSGDLVMYSGSGWIHYASHA
ncbi:MAG: hypothetical protein WC998_06015, partial [Candidatus Paceibacterota bacterium]